MPQIGAQPISLRGPGPWGGLTTLSKSVPLRFLELENGYVNSDGSEIRTFPGYAPVLDAASTLRVAGAEPSGGFQATHIDARRPASVASGGYFFEAAPTESMRIWTKPTQLHCVEFVHGRWVFVGESDYRRELIHDLARTANTYVYVTAYQDDGFTYITLTVNTQPSTTAGLFNAVVAGDRIAVNGATGVLATLLNNSGFLVDSFPTATTIRLLGTSGGVVGLTSGQTALVHRVPRDPSASPTVISDDKEALTIWTSLARGDVAAVSNVVYAAHVANRMRDFGDATGNVKEGNRNAGSAGKSRRRQRELPYRLVPHVAGNRLILVAPGYGCVFQAPQVIPPNFDEATAANGIFAIGNDIFDRPRALGVPKAVVWEDPDKAVATSYHIFNGAAIEQAFGGSAGGVVGRVGTYLWKFAYVDEATGDVGLCSEPISITTDAATYVHEHLRFQIYFPGYLMHETLAINVNVYRTVKGGTQFYFDRQIQLNGILSTGLGGAFSSRYGLDPEVATVEYFHHARFVPTYTSDAILMTHGQIVPDTIQQMPMGCKAARTFRGWTLFGGSLGDAGSRKELKQGTLSFQYDKVALDVNGLGYRNDTVSSVFTNDSAPTPITGSFEGVESGFGCSARSIPPAYAGQTIIWPKLMPFPRKMLTIDRLANTLVGWTGAALNGYSGRIQDVRYSVLDTPLVPEFDFALTLFTAYLALPRARLQISEADNPGITPATNTTLLANERDDDIESIGELGGQPLVCTRSRGYSVGFTTSPVGVPPDIATDKFGCIAANSMVSFAGGCAWLSERGPCAMIGGEAVFIGESLEQYFIGETSRYLRDSDGMMRHSWGVHDAERSLLYFGVFADRNAGTGLAATVSYRGSTYTWVQAQAHADRDQIQSRFGCDEVLVYSYMVGAWSVWRPPGTFTIQWMTRGVDANGIARVFFLGSDKRLYVLDDTYGMGDKDSWRSISVQDYLTVNLIVTASSSQSWIGLPVMVYSSTQPAVLKGLATIIDQPSPTLITIDTPITPAIGDIILVGARSMTLRSTFLNTKGTETARVGKVGMRYALWSRVETGDSSDVQHCFASVNVASNALREGIPTKTVPSLTAEGGAVDYTWLGANGVDDPVHDKGFQLGASAGLNHQVRMTIVGGAQARIHDLSVEVQ